MARAHEPNTPPEVAPSGRRVAAVLERAQALEPVVSHVARWGLEAGRVLLLGCRTGLVLSRQMARGPASRVVHLEAMPFGVLGPGYAGIRRRGTPVVVVAGARDLDARAQRDIAVAARVGMRVALFTDVAGSRLAGEHAAASLALSVGPGLAAGQEALLSLLELQLLRGRRPAVRVAS